MRILMCVLLMVAACGDDDADTGEVASTAAAAITTEAITTSAAEETTTTRPATTTTVADTTTTAELETTTAPQPEFPLSTVTEAVAFQYGQDVECAPYTDGPITAGSIVTCVPQPVPTDSQYPVLTALVLEGGTVSTAIGGLFNLGLNPDIVGDAVPPGLNCTDLLADDSAFSSLVEYLDDASRYFGTVLYWYLEGRPSPLMDIDENMIPCETLFATETVIDVYDGGLFGRLPAGLADVVLAPNGLGIVAFGTDAEETTELVAAVLGPSAEDTGYQQTGCEGIHREVTWVVPAPSEGGVATRLTLHFTDFERPNAQFTDYAYWRAFDAEEPLGSAGALRTPEGIGVGSSTIDVFATYPEIEFGMNQLDFEVYGWTESNMLLYPAYNEPVDTDTDYAEIEGWLIGLRYRREGCNDELA